jgi:hypothetical protein
VAAFIELKVAKKEAKTTTAKAKSASLLVRIRESDGWFITKIITLPR